MKNLREGLIGEWLFDGGEAKDTSGNGHHGTVNGPDSTQDTLGRNARALDFIAANSDNVTISDHADLSFTDGAGTDKPFTIAALVNIDTSVKFRIVSKNDDTLREYLFGTDGGSRNSLYLYTDSSNYIFRQGAVLPTGTYLLVCTYDGTEVNTGINLYTNGALDNSSAGGGGSYTGMPNTAADLYIGEGKWATPDYADGQMSWVRLWNRELDADEVWQLYTDIKGNYQGLFDGCVGLWDMRGDALDSSGQGNDGTVTGASLTTDRFGITDSAYSFGAAATDRIVLPSSLNGGTDITEFSLLIVSDIGALSPLKRHFSYNDAGDDCLFLFDHDTGLTPDNGRAWIQTSSGLEQIRTDSLAVGVNYIFISGSEGNDCELFINNVSQGTLSMSGKTFVANVVADNAVIGNDSSFGYSPDADIEIVGFWNRELSTGERATLHRLLALGDLHPYRRAA